MLVVKAAVLGCGSVNKNLLIILNNKKELLANEYGVAFHILAATDSSGIVYCVDNNNNNKGDDCNGENNNNGNVTIPTTLDPMALVDHKNSGGHMSDFPAQQHHQQKSYKSTALSSSSSSLLARAKSMNKNNKNNNSSSIRKGTANEIQRILNTLDLDLIFEATPCAVGNLVTSCIIGATTTTAMTSQSSNTTSYSSGSCSYRQSDALSICKSALSRGVSVVLANKGPLVQAMDHLLKLSEPKGTRSRLEFSATVCGGLPILNIGKRDMIGGEITKLRGVFNATSNFVMDAMSKGCSFQKAIEVAKQVGAAEEDPTLDTGGWDTAFKLLIIANTIMGANIQLKDISVEGIHHVTQEMIQTHAKQNKVIKLVATAKGDKFAVRPISLPFNSFLGSVEGWEMGIEIYSDVYGVSCHKLTEKEPIPTAASMLRDALHIFRPDATSHNHKHNNNNINNNNNHNRTHRRSSSVCSSLTSSLR